MPLLSSPNCTMFLQALGSAAKNVRRAISVFMLLGLLAMNVLSLTSSAVHDFLYKGLAALPLATYLQNSPSAKQQKLLQQNKALKQKMAARKAASKKIAQRIAARTARATTTNVASVFTESIPVYGIAFIIATTAYEVSAACENLKDMDAMLIELGVEENQPETRQVCGQEIPSKEEVIEKIELSKNQLSQLSRSLADVVNNTTNNSLESWDNFKQHIRDLIQ